MNVLILGGDGYTGWPLAMHMAMRGHDVTVVDNYEKRTMAESMNRVSLIDTPSLEDRVRRFYELTGNQIKVQIGNCAWYDFLCDVMIEEDPDVIVHYAEIPSAPYSMIGYDQAFHTLDNNLNSTLSLIHAVINHAPNAHIVKAGTMGEYGTPNVPIKEGWLDVESNGREHTFRYPSTPGSLYHVTKVQDTEMLWLYAKVYGLRVTDIMQGPVYGISTNETDMDTSLATNFHYDDLFGTVLNRFVVQALSGVPLTVYGKGGQKRGYINLRDVMKAIEIISYNPPKSGELRIINQVVSFHTVNDLAELVKEAGEELGLKVEIDHVHNPRQEMEEHFLEVENKWLPDHGLVSHGVDKDFVKEFILAVQPYAENINKTNILPEFSWNQ